MQINARPSHKAARKALLHLDSGRLADAERLLRSLLNSEPGHPDANHGLGLLAMRQGKPQTALPLLTAALQANPSEGQYWLSFAAGLLMAGSIGDARAVLDKAAGRGLSGPEIAALRRQIDHAELHQLAVDHQKSGRFDEAGQLYARILSADPAHADSLHMMGVLAIQTGRAEEAVSLIGQAIAENASVAAFHGNLGSALAALARRDEAIRSLQRAIQLDPDDTDARSNLANVLADHGLHDAALVQHRETIRLRPDNANAHNGLGNFYKKISDFAQATECYERAAVLDPNFALAHNNMGTLLRDIGRLDEAVSRYERALGINPEFAEAHYNLATLLFGLDRTDEARRHFERAIQLRPHFPEAFTNLGNLHQQRGRPDEAIACYERVIALGGDAAKAHNNIGAIKLERQQPGEAIEHLLEAVRLDPDLAEACNNLGTAMNDIGDLDQAYAHYCQALALKPDYAEAMSNLAGNLRRRGKVTEAIEHYRAAIALSPSLIVAHNSLIMLLGYADVAHQEVFKQAASFNAITGPLLRKRPFGNVVAPQRRLKAGYVSGDFRSHAVNYFFEPLLLHHDRHQFEFFAYSTSASEDEVTARLKPRFDHWRNIRPLTDDAAADLIEADGIDILVDLSGHMADNRLLVFARKPAPIQATWLGFTSTTGVSAIDYRITDHFTDPVGMTEHLHTETLWRLPATFCSYEPRADIPQPIDHPPSEDNGYVTFGCFNNFTKVSDRTLKAWGAILARMPDARLLLEIIGIDGAVFREETVERLRRLGVPVERVILEPRKRANQYVLYDRVDIALDPFPFNGGTTTLDAIWMGVPVVSITGDYFVARLGVMILNHIGIPELISRDEADYVDVAVALAMDRPRLRATRHGLRQRMAASRMMDHAAFARDIETAYRGMWEIWCAEQNAAASRTTGA